MYPELWVMPGTGWTLKSYGFMMMVGFLSAVYIGMRRAMRVKCDPDAILNIAFISLMSGVVGSRVFFVIHYWEESFADTPNPWLAAINITQGGLEFLLHLLELLAQRDRQPSRGMRLCQHGVEFESSATGISGPPQLTGIAVVIHEEVRVAVGQTGVGQRKSWILADRLFEHFDGVADRLPVGLIEVLAPA